MFKSGEKSNSGLKSPERMRQQFRSKQRAKTGSRKMRAEQSDMQNEKHSTKKQSVSPSGSL